MAALDEIQERPGRRRKGAAAPADALTAGTRSSPEPEVVEEAPAYRTREAVTIMQNPPHWADLPQAAPEKDAVPDAPPAEAAAPAGPESPGEEAAQTPMPLDALPGEVEETPVGGRDARPMDKEE